MDDDFHLDCSRRYDVDPQRRYDGFCWYYFKCGIWIPAGDFRVYLAASGPGMIAASTGVSLMRDEK